MKIITEKEVASWIESHLGKERSVAIGGLLHANRPTALIRALIRNRIGRLTLYSSPVSGYDVDLLIAARNVEKMYLPAVTLESMLAPNFRWAVEEGAVQAYPVDVVSLVAGFKAGAQSLPFYPIPYTSLAGSDVTAYNPLLIEAFSPLNPNEKYFAARPITPDVAMIHADKVDEKGNVYYSSVHSFMDSLMAYAAKKVIVSAEEIVTLPDWRTEETVIPCNQVDAIVEIPYGAHPASCGTRYHTDEAFIREYARTMEEARINKDRRLVQSYIQEYVFSAETQQAYLKLRSRSSHFESLK